MTREQHPTLHVSPVPQPAGRAHTAPIVEATTMQQFTVHLQVRQRSGYLSARSDDVPGLHITGSDLADVRQRAMPAVRLLLKANRHLDVDVFPTDVLTELRVRERPSAAAAA